MPNLRVSTESKQLRGTFQACRSNPDEPAPPTGIPEMPKNLTKSGRKYWRDVIEQLQGMKTLSIADGFAIARLAEAMGDLHDARAALDERDGLTYKNEKGAILPWPENDLRDRADRRVHQWIGKLGLTPADRSRVSAIKDDTPEDDFMRLLQSK
jgi:P27 family predicted phage terminase small subunit